jgi:RNA polymerase sigma-70 factor (ECF subfamily)
MVGLTENLDFEEEDETVRKQELEERYRAVDKIVEECLTDLQRNVFRMKEYEGLGYSDIAKRLGIQETAVRMNLSRARKQIRMCYLKQQNR